LWDFRTDHLVLRQTHGPQEGLFQKITRQKEIRKEVDLAYSERTSPFVSTRLEHNF